MRIDELRRELADIVNAGAGSEGDASAAMLAGRRRLALRRFVAASAACLVAAAVFVVIGVTRNDDKRQGVVVTPSVPTVPVTIPATAPGSSAVAPVPPPPLRPNRIIFTSSDEGWICGDALFHTADGGGTWQAVAYRQQPETDASHVCGAAGHDAWVLSGSVVVPVQGGSDTCCAGEFGPLPANTSISQVMFVDTSHGWVLAGPNGEGRGTLYRTTNGIGFTVVTSDAPTGPIEFADANNGWGIGAGNLERTTDGGATWQPEGYGVPLTSDAPSFLTDIDVEGSTVVVAGGVTGGNLYQPFFDVTVNGGRKWEVRSDPNMSFAATLDVDLAVVDADHWRVVTGNRLWVTDDGGRTWGSRSLPGMAGPAVSIAFPTADVGWTIIEDRVMQTTDAGRSWHAVDMTPQRPWMTGLAAVPNECPGEPTTPATDADPRAAAVEAAQDFVRRTRGWIGAEVKAYPVLNPPADSYGVVFERNVPKFCGRAVAEASYGVDLANSSITLDSSRSSALVVAHFAEGWRVWGFYR